MLISRLLHQSQGLHTIAAILQTSVLAPHLLPRITSGDLYCLVWMSLVKWWPTQHALPRSAILTEIVSKARSSTIFSPEVSVFEEEVVLDLSRLIPETSLVKRSLDYTSVAIMQPSQKRLTQSFLAASERHRRWSWVA